MSLFVFVLPGACVTWECAALSPCGLCSDGAAAGGGVPLSSCDQRGGGCGQGK